MRNYSEITILREDTEYLTGPIRRLGSHMYGGRAHSPKPAIMSNDIIIIERARCWNRGGCLFPSPMKAVTTAFPAGDDTKDRLRRILESFRAPQLVFEEGFEDLYAIARSAPRRVRFLDCLGRELAGVDDALRSIVVEYGEDDGIGSPVLVETYSLRVLCASWEFIADEEFHHGHIPYIQAGILTNGEGFLYWNVTEDDNGRLTRHIHNSILMDSDTEEVWYPWTAENDAKVIAALNDPATSKDWCGESSVLLSVEFDDWDEGA